jgi:hypothetical protein
MIAACVSPAQSFPSPCSPAPSSSSRRARLQRRARSFPTPRSFGRSSGRPMRGSRIDRSAGRARTRSTLGAAGPGRMRWPRSRTATSASRTSPSGSRAAGRASGRTEATRAGTSASRRRRRCCASGGWPAAAEARSRGGRTPCTVRRNLVPNFVPNSAQLTPLGAPQAAEKRLDAAKTTPIWQLIIRQTQVRVLAAPSGRPVNRRLLHHDKCGRLSARACPSLCGRVDSDAADNRNWFECSGHAAGAHCGGWCSGRRRRSRRR